MPHRVSLSDKEVVALMVLLSNLKLNTSRDGHFFGSDYYHKYTGYIPASSFFLITNKTRDKLQKIYDKIISHE